MGSSSSSPELRDAREILEERRAEDGRVTIERQRLHRRRRTREIDAYAAGAGAIDYGGGCLALTPSLRQVEWPSKFSPRIPAIYDGDTNPSSFLQLYSTAMKAAGVDHKIMANWFPLALGPMAQKWMMHLP